MHEAGAGTPSVLSVAGIEAKAWGGGALQSKATEQIAADKYLGTMGPTHAKCPATETQPSERGLVYQQL